MNYQISQSPHSNNSEEHDGTNQQEYQTQSDKLQDQTSSHMLNEYIYQSQQKQAQPLVQSKRQKYEILHNNKIDYIQYEDLQELNQNKKTEEAKRPKWNKCINPKKQPDLQRQSQLKKCTKPSIKMSNKQNINTNTNTNVTIVQRNKQWVQSRNKKIFEKARTNFMRAKQLCFFDTKRK